jgi:hypothetical protein
MKNRKAQTLAINKIIVLVLILLVVVLVLIAVFKLDIQKWLNFLPSFGTQERTNYVDKCPVKIAEIKDGMIFFCNQETNVCDISSKLQVDGKKIQVDYAIDEDIGQITMNLIIIFEDIIRRESKLYSSVAKDLPDYYYILNLNGAYLHSKTEICRDEIMHEEKIEYSPEEKIGELGYKSDWYALWLNGKMRIYIPISPPKDSGLYVENNYIMKGDSKIGVILDNKLTIYSSEMQKSYPNVIDKNTGLTLEKFLIGLNGSERIAGEIYKKNE